MDALHIAVTRSFTKPTSNQGADYLRMSHQLGRHFPNRLDPALVPFKVRQPKLHHTGLPGPQHLSRPPDFQVFLGDEEAILTVPQGL